MAPGGNSSKSLSSSSDDSPPRASFPGFHSSSSLAEKPSDKDSSSSSDIVCVGECLCACCSQAHMCVWECVYMCVCVRMCHLQLLIFTAHFWRCTSLVLPVSQCNLIDYDSFHLLLLLLLHLLAILILLFLLGFLSKSTKFTFPRLVGVGLGTSDRRTDKQRWSIRCK